MRFITLFALLLLPIVRGSPPCGDNTLTEYTFGACDNVTKDQRVIYSKTCIDEYDNRNYTVGWAGEHEVTCIQIATNGNKVDIYTGGIGQKVAVILVESTTGEELEWEANVYVKRFKKSAFYRIDVNK